MLFGLENKVGPNGNPYMVFFEQNSNGDLIHKKLDDYTSVILIDLTAHTDVSLKDMSTGTTQNEPASTTRIVAHELGHATGEKDNEANRINNVNKNENPIMNRLEDYVERYTSIENDSYPGNGGNRSDENKNLGCTMHNSIISRMRGQ